jgi:hypothetical protein
MRRAAALFVLAALGAAPAATAQAPSLRASITACTTGAVAEERTLTVTAAMPAGGASRMAVRFDLLQRRPGTGWRRVWAPTLGRWERSQPGRAGFVYHKRVGSLRAPALYRAVVRFRWLDAEGRVLRQARRLAGTCRQPDPRPDLRVLRLVATPIDGDLVRWSGVVQNAGRGDAPAGSALLEVGTRPGLAAPVPALGAGRQATVTWDGPHCAEGDAVRVTADHDGRIDEADERNNALTIACPAIAR